MTCFVKAVRLLGLATITAHAIKVPQKDDTPAPKKHGRPPVRAALASKYEDWPTHPSMKSFHEGPYAAQYRKKMKGQVEDLMSVWYANGEPFVKLATLRSMLKSGRFASCTAYFRVVNGKVFFKYQGMGSWYFNLRTNLVAVSLQDAVDVFKLADVKTELVINTCDHPLSMSSSIANQRGGYPVFVPHYGSYALDMPFPDPLDLTSRYVNVRPAAKTWEQRKSQAVFRGKGNNFEMNEDYNWHASPRFRLQKMSENNPDLIDARVTGWHEPKGATDEQKEAIERVMREDGYEIRKDQRLTLVELMDDYKYGLIAEGGLGDGRLCGVMLSGGVPMVQELTHVPYFWAALQNGTDILATKRYSQDLKELITWAKDHDDAAHDIAVMSQTKASPLMCTWEGRLEYWALLLKEWNKAIIDKENISEPEPGMIETATRPTRAAAHILWSDAESVDRWNSAWSERLCNGPACDLDRRGMPDSGWSAARPLSDWGVERPALLQSLKAQTGQK